MKIGDWIRFDRREERFEPVTIDLGDLLSGIERDLEPLAVRKSQILNVRPGDVVGMSLIADINGLKRVLHNLINNAIQHLGENCRIEVRAEAENNHVLFTVSDNGPGISEETQTKLFSYTSMTDNHQQVIKGTGLGLYIARRIVERHGGQIWVESGSSTGTTFYFTIPKRPLAYTQKTHASPPGKLGHRARKRLSSVLSPR